MTSTQSKDSRNWYTAKEDEENLLVRIALSPYHQFYLRNTKKPILAILNAEDPMEGERRIRKWGEMKQNENRYVQVASILMFNAVISSLSWSTAFQRHWTCPAFWYASMLFSLIAIPLAAQQTLVFETIDSRKWRETCKKLAYEDSEKKWRCRGSVLYVFQSHIQCFSYSVVCFLAGFVSYIYSPLAMERGWNDNAKIAVIFGIAMLAVSIFFIVSSMKLYQAVNTTDLSEVEMPPKSSSNIALRSPSQASVTRPVALAV